ncbi:MAG: hypothetical protein ABIP06_08185 [Pyrinomonadaceae bacterium]
MKKFVIGMLMFLVFAVTVPLSVDAHCGSHRRARRSNVSRNYARTNRRYATRSYTATRRPSFYRRHRNVINLGLATGGGALIGALVGGKRGAGYGSLIGLGSGALYTYGLNKKKRRY